MVRELQRETCIYGMSRKYHSVSCQGHPAYTGRDESSEFDVPKYALSDEQIKTGCENGLGASSSERTARKAVILLVLCVNGVAGGVLYGICP